MIHAHYPYFHIDTPKTSYVFKVNPLGMLEHLYYGKRIPVSPAYPFLEEGELYGQGLVTEKGGSAIYEDGASFEISSFRRGDFREGLLKADFGGGDGEFSLVYDGYEILKGFEMPGLPNSHGKEETLAISMKDEARGLAVTLYYSVFDDCDVITRSVKVTNRGKNELSLRRVLSSEMDIPDGGYDLLSLHGAWAKERQISRGPLHMGLTKIASDYGFSSAQTNPFTMLLSKNADETHGDAYGFNLVYSGSHMTSFERGSYHKIRVLSGINDYDFLWALKPGESFFAPEATLCYSDKGIGGVRKNYHRFVREHIIPERHAHEEKPILLNSWEGTHFSFDEDKLLSMAEKAKELGIEMFVLDDGWFGERNSDDRSLGDWHPNLRKLPHRVSGLSKKIHALGLRFGLWVEPEMVSPDSDLYRAHPDWAIRHPGYTPLQGRNQYVLDLANPEVVDYLIKTMGDLFEEAKLDYVKWDCNRDVSDGFSPAIDNQGEYQHRYILGLYRLMGALTARFPKILFESCSAGGNRADLGMLSYMPQFWGSDNTDSFDREKIQEGTLLWCPPCAIGAHVSASPSRQTLRIESLEDKFNVACIGAFGYELDVTKLTPEEEAIIKRQIAFYKAHRALFQEGEYTQISFLSSGHEQYTLLSPNKREAVYFLGNGAQEAYAEPVRIRPRGLDPKATYRVESRPMRISIAGGYADSEPYRIEASGESLNNAGALLPYEFLAGNGPKTRYMGDFGTRLYEIKKID